MQTGKHIYILKGHTDKLKNIETDRHTYRQKDRIRNRKKVGTDRRTDKHIQKKNLKNIETAENRQTE